MASMNSLCGHSSVGLLSIHIMPDGTVPDAFYLVLGGSWTRFNAKTLIKINMVEQEPKVSPIVKASPGSVLKIDYNTLEPRDVLELATGYSDENIWLRWLEQNAREQMGGDCVACASARPRLVTGPAPLFPEDEWGYKCMLQLTKKHSPANCEILEALYPAIDNRTKVGPFTPRKGDGPYGSYVCFNFTTPTVKKVM